MSLQELVRRPDPLNVHTPILLQCIIPDFVMAFLGKGNKFIPDRYRLHVKDHLQSLHQLCHSARCAVHFDRHDDNSRSVTRCRLPSTWSPPAVSSIDCFERLVAQRLLQYRARPMHSNWHYFDRQAVAWLKKHRDELSVCDSDKGLGDAIMPKTWILDQCASHLSKSASKLDHDTFGKNVRDCADALHHHCYVAFDDGAIRKQHFQFLVSGLNDESKLKAGRLTSPTQTP